MADGVILIENCTLYGLSVAITDEQFKNIRPVFDAAGVPTSKYNSGKLHQYFNIELVGQEHNAMHDVRSLTHLLFALY